MSSILRHSAIQSFGTTTLNELLNMGAIAQERSQAYWLLSRLFLKAPDAAHLRQLQIDLAAAFEPGPLGELRDEVDSCMAEPASAISEFSRQLAAMTLTGDREPPYESFAREGKVPGKVTESVAGWMGEAGFSDVARDAPSPDHIGIELKFMALQCYEESQAWTSGRQGDARRLIAAQRHFLSRHLGAWAPEYCERLEERASHSYVRAIARLARRCLIAEVATVEALYLKMNAPGHRRHDAIRHRPGVAH